MCGRPGHRWQNCRKFRSTVNHIIDATDCGTLIGRLADFPRVDESCANETGAVVNKVGTEGDTADTVQTARVCSTEVVHGSEDELDAFDLISLHSTPEKRSGGVRWILVSDAAPLSYLGRVVYVIWSYLLSCLQLVVEQVFSFTTYCWTTFLLWFTLEIFSDVTYSGHRFFRVKKMSTTCSCEFGAECLSPLVDTGSPLPLCARRSYLSDVKPGKVR